MAFVKQKTKVIGLKVVVDAQVDNELVIKRGSVVYIPEEVLYNQTSYQKPLTAERIKEPFVVIDFGHVIFVGE
jgi:hypothetical protein